MTSPGRASVPRPAQVLSAIIGTLSAMDRNRCPRSSESAITREARENVARHLRRELRWSAEALDEEVSAWASFDIARERAAEWGARAWWMLPRRSATPRHRIDILATYARPLPAPGFAVDLIVLSARGERWLSAQDFAQRRAEPSVSLYSVPVEAMLTLAEARARDGLSVCRA